jgi:hypothetical protein
MISQAFNPLERDVMTLLLAGYDPRSCALRTQLDAAEPLGREIMDRGFSCRIQVDYKIAAPIPERQFLVGNVVADIENLKYGAGFILWIEDGYVSLLEGYTFGEQWPATFFYEYKLRYAEGLS